MNEFQIAILIGAIATAFISRHLPHAIMWIFFAALNAVACDIYMASGLPHPEVMNLSCDALLCLAIHWKAQERWELRLFNIYQLSVLFSVLRLLNMITSEYAYATALELCNWAALFLISGTAIFGKVRPNDSVLRNNWRAYVRRAATLLRRPRETPHWSKARGR